MQASRDQYVWGYTVRVVVCSARFRNNAVALAIGKLLFIRDAQSVAAPPAAVPSPATAAPPAASDSPVGPGLVHVQELCKPWFELVTRFIFELLLCSRLC